MISTALKRNHEMWGSNFSLFLERTNILERQCVCLKNPISFLEFLRRIWIHVTIFLK